MKEAGVKAIIGRIGDKVVKPIVNKYGPKLSKKLKTKMEAENFANSMKEILNKRKNK